MAKKKARKSKPIRRRRIGGLGALNANSPLVKFGAMAAGYFLGDKINAQIDKITGDKVDGKIVAAAEAGAGLFLVFKKGKKTLPLTLIGGVLAGAGIKKGLTEFGVINGFHNVPVLGGYRSVPQINGYNTTPGSHLGGYKVPQVVGGIYQDENNGGSGITDRD